MVHTYNITGYQGIALDRRVLLTSKSERAKAIDFHPTEPWVAVGLYNGTLTITNYHTQALVKSIQVCSVPIRCIKFIQRRNWILVGSDDFTIRVYNYNTLERVQTIEAHSDYIRSMAVHPTKPLFLTTSDDTLIKLWDWDSGWRCVMTFEGHQHYVMQAVFNPKDPNTFASCSLDRSIKIWSLGSSSCNYTLDGHDKGVNSVGFYQGGDRPYLASGSDDGTVRVWDYQSKACVRVLAGHTQNVTCLCFHPRLPFLLSASEDGSVRVWSTSSFRAELVMNAGLDRLWGLSLSEQQGEIGLAGDLGSSVMLLGKGEPAVSMDQSNGKIVWAQQTTVCSARVSELPPDGKLRGGKDLGQSDFIAGAISFSPNNRFITVHGDGEYTVFTAVAWRNRAFGRGLEFVWGGANVGNNVFAVRDSPSKITIFEDFGEIGSIKSTDVPFDRIYGLGPLLAVSGAGYVLFYDYRSGELVQAIEQDVHSIQWSLPTQDEYFVSLLGIPKGLFILKYSSPEQHFSIAQSSVDTPDRVRGGLWIGGQAFVYAGADSGKISYWLSDTDKTQLVAVSEESLLYPLGYYENRVYFVDKDLTVRSWSLPLNLLRYQSLVLQGDLAGAGSVLKDATALDDETANKLGKFLEHMGHYSEAVQIAKDPQLLFSLNLKLGRIAEAKSYLDSHFIDNPNKHRQLGQAALTAWKPELATESMLKGGDYGSAILISGVLSKAAEMAPIKHLNNVSFSLFYLQRQYSECYNLLMSAQKYPEAAMFAQSHGLSGLQVQQAVQEWKSRNQQSSDQNSSFKKKICLADPIENPESFPINIVALNSSSNLRQPDTSDLGRKASVKSIDDDLLSVEVNTTGTGSMRTDDVEEAMMAIGNGLPTHQEYDDVLYSEDDDAFDPQKVALDMEQLRVDDGAFTYETDCIGFDGSNSGISLHGNEPSHEAPDESLDDGAPPNIVPHDKAYDPLQPPSDNLYNNSIESESSSMKDAIDMTDMDGWN